MVRVVWRVGLVRKGRSKQGERVENTPVAPGWVFKMRRVSKRRRIKWRRTDSILSICIYIRSLGTTQDKVVNRVRQKSERNPTDPMIKGGEGGWVSSLTANWA
jgi:hypothetical protein